MPSPKEASLILNKQRPDYIHKGQSTITDANSANTSLGNSTPWYEAKSETLVVGQDNETYSEALTNTVSYVNPEYEIETQSDASAVMNSCYSDNQAIAEMDKINMKCTTTENIPNESLDSAIQNGIEGSTLTETLKPHTVLEYRCHSDSQPNVLPIDGCNGLPTCHNPIYEHQCKETPTRVCLSADSGILSEEPIISRAPQDFSNYVKKQIRENETGEEAECTNILTSEA